MDNVVVAYFLLHRCGHSPPLPIDRFTALAAWHWQSPYSANGRQMLALCIGTVKETKYYLISFKSQQLIRISLPIDIHVNRIGLNRMAEYQYGCPHNAHQD